ncbi:MAG: phage tail sheath subtilisin-like domain-containing protein [Nevskia sp.]|nr:phage tail sheath subtilisin-like domain-containing protein [Nevskia sp.]
MAVAVSYPGVYIQEVPSGVRTIASVATSIAAFVDFFPSGPLNEASEIFSFADFESQFGGLDTRSEASYAIQQFFLNGGSAAYVVRVTSGTPANAAIAAAIALEDKSGGSVLLTATASSPGAWGNNVRIDVDYNTTDPTSLFNLTVTEVASVNGNTTVVATETYRNLVVDPTKPNDAAAVVNAASQLITLSEASGSSGKRPAQTGTASKAITSIGALGLAAGDTLNVSLGATSLGSIAGLTTVPTTLAALASTLQTALRGLQSGGKAALPNATVSVAGSASTQAYLVVKSGTASPADYLVISDAAPGGLATKLGFAANTGAQNVQQYALGGAAAQAQALPGANQLQGSDGTWDPSGDASGVALGLIGDPNAKTGMYALLDVDLFNILCIPATMNLPDLQTAQVAADATALCTQRRAMYVLDVPQHDGVRDTVPAIQTWLDANAGLRSRNAALYFPRMDIADPLNNFRLRQVAPSGTVAGLWARTDGARGVWKAPAGTEATLTGVQALEYKLTDPENGVLNPLAINCLRNFPVYGPVCWGARTLYGADQMADDYKYIPIRRLALFIEESLYRGTQWVVFEPNDSPLWAQIRLNVGAFMQTLFRQGAFQGSTPADAYFVQCDDKTNPQATIDLGIVNIVVGFAPLKPAEFVVIQIQQMAGQLAS